MTDYTCPPIISKLLADERSAAAKGRRMHLEWVKTLPLKRGDRVEIVFPDHAEWRTYEPPN